MAKISANYEVVFIIDPAQGEEGVAALTEKFKTLVEQNSSAMEVEEWGKRKLAYAINYITEGYYVLISFTSAPEFPKETHCVELTESTINANSRLFDSIDDVPREAYTMGIGTIMAAKEILVVANGSDKADIVGMFYEVRPEVILGGGSAYFLPQGTPGSKRKDSTNYLELFQKDGYKFVSDRTELLAAVDGKAPQKLLGLFHTGNMDGWIDRHQWKGNTVKKFPNQPDLTDAFDAAVKVLGQNKEGFFLMLEAGLVDKFSHPLDWTRSVGDTIAFDKVVERAQKYVDEHPDTLLIVTGDHTHSISVAGTVDDNKPGKDMREKVGVYADAGYPNYVDADKDGFPDDFAPSKRLAVFFGAHPDYYETYRAYPDKTFNPAVKNEKGEYVADETYKSVEGGHFVEGNLPRNESQGVHTVDDLVVTARGPKSEEIKGFMNSTEIFRVMAEALALGH